MTAATQSGAYVIIFKPIIFMNLYILEEGVNHYTSATHTEQISQEKQGNRLVTEHFVGCWKESRIGILLYEQAVN